jgi:YaiO family outer membrane protein
MKFHPFSAPFLIAFASSAHAVALPNLQRITASVDGEYLSYTGAFGNRRIVNAETRMDMGKTLVTVSVAQGARKAGDEKFHATRFSGSVAHNWSSRLSTRTAASIASDKPIFVTRELLQEVSYKPFPRTIVTVGGRYSRYFGNVEALSWSLGAAQYFRGGSISYRFSAYDVHHLGHSTGHLVSFRFTDRYGSNQLWLGHGTALHDAVWLPVPEKGRYTNVELRRLQPIGGGVSATLGVNRIWYKADGANFRGTGVRVGLVFAKQGIRY